MQPFAWRRDGKEAMETAHSGVNVGGGVEGEESITEANPIVLLLGSRNSRPTPAACNDRSPCHML